MVTARLTRENYEFDLEEHRRHQDHQSWTPNSEGILFSRSLFRRENPRGCYTGNDEPPWQAVTTTCCHNIEQKFAWPAVENNLIRLAVAT